MFKTLQFAEVKAASERAFDQERKAARYQAQADRAKEGSAVQGRAQREADYHGSLAEAERHRASAARAHILGPEIARAKGARDVVREDKDRTDRIYRNERKLAEMNRFRSAYEPKLESVDRQLDSLVARDSQGFLKRENGKYVPKDPKDRAKVLQLQKEQDRLIRKLGFKNTPNQALAQKFVDFMLSQQFQEDMPLNMFVYPANQNAKLPDVFVKYAEVAENPAVISYAEIAANRDAWIEAWTEAMK